LGGKKKKILAVGITAVIWSIWKTRNLACFEKKWPDEPYVVILKICYYINCWSLLQVKEDAKGRLEFCAKVLEKCNGNVWVKEKLDFMDVEADDVGRIKLEGRKRRLATKGKKRKDATWCNIVDPDGRRWKFATMETFSFLVSVCFAPQLSIFCFCLLRTVVCGKPCL
jgi:hypothetical protein